MARIVGVEIPSNKKVNISLRYLYGIGPTRAMEICQNTGVDPDKRVKDLSEDEISKIATYIQQNYRVEGELRTDVMRNIKRLTDIGCYSGLRHKLGLPVRGQRTRSNSRTRKGPRPSRIKKKGK